MWLVQIGLGDSETEHTGDEPGEMGEDLSVANLGGVCSSTSLFYACCLSARLPSIKPVPFLGNSSPWSFIGFSVYFVLACVSSILWCVGACDPASQEHGVSVQQPVVSRVQFLVHEMPLARVDLMSCHVIFLAARFDMQIRCALSFTSSASQPRPKIPPHRVTDVKTLPAIHACLDLI